MTKKYSAVAAQKWLEDGLKEGSGPRRFAIDAISDIYTGLNLHSVLINEYGPYTLAVEVELDEEMVK